MKPLFIFCHGWGFDQQFFEPLIKKYFPTVGCYSLDLGYFGNEKINLPTGQPFIGVGHSLGFIKLVSLKVKFRALIGIQAFINFLGFDPQLQKKRKLALKTMFNCFQRNPMDTLSSFHKRCGLDYTLPKSFNTTKLMQDLALLATTHPLPPIPLLIIGAKNDTIVPPALIYDNFSNFTKYAKVIVHHKGHHCLGLYEGHFIHQQVINFLYGIGQSIHTT